MTKPTTKSKTKPPKPPTYQQRARESIGQWIKTRGMTLGAVGGQLSPPRDAVFVSRFLRGKVDADVDTLFQFAAIFGNPPMLLFSPTPEETDAENPIVKIATAYAAMTAANRELIVTLAESLARSLVAPRRGVAEKPPTTKKKPERADASSEARELTV